MKCETLIVRNRFSSRIAKAGVSFFVFLTGLEFVEGEKLAEAKLKTSSDSAMKEVLPPLTSGETSIEKCLRLEAEVESGTEFKADKILLLARAKREQKCWGEVAKLYTKWLDHTESSELKEKISKELVYCERRANGWILPPAKDAYTANLRSLEMVFPLTPPKLMQQTLEKLISQFPDRWELLVFRARNSISMGQLSDAEAAIVKAIELGGEGAKVSASAVRKEIDRRSALNETGKKAAALLKSGKKKDAADLLGKAWEKDSDAVEFGLKSCQLLVENRDFEDAATLSGKIGSYLAEHPDHPMAKEAPLLAVAAEKSTEADKLRDKMGAPSKNPVSQNRSPAKSANKGTKSSGGSMADKFRNRTQ